MKVKMNYKKLRFHCLAPIAYYHTLGQYVPVRKNAGYTFIDRGANVLAIAHLDMVVRNPGFWRTQNGDVVWSGALDDRLGVYTILETLKDLPVDILLTEDEEFAMSTGEDFKAPHQYNWMFEFDRSGQHPVGYMYKTPELQEVLRGYGLSLGHGSYTDISSMQELRCTGINFGTAYYNAHSPDCHVIVEEWKWSVRKFLEFFMDYKDVYLKHEPVASAKEIGRCYIQSLYKQDDLFDWRDGPYTWKDDLLTSKSPIISQVCPICEALVSSSELEEFGGICEECAAWCERMNCTEEVMRWIGGEQ